MNLVLLEVLSGFLDVIVLEFDHGISDRVLNLLCDIEDYESSCLSTLAGRAKHPMRQHDDAPDLADEVLISVQN